jgi:periplasmic copper chaperone A
MRHEPGKHQECRYAARPTLKGVGMKRSVLVILIFAVLSAPAFAAVTIKDPWIRATTPHQKSTAAFMQLTSSNDARLVKAESPVAKSVEIHQMVMKNYVMKMQAVPAIELPAGKSVELKPDGYLVMLVGLKQQIKEGDSIPISVTVEGKDRKRETIKLEASAMTMNGAATGEHSAAHM